LAAEDNDAPHRIQYAQRYFWGTGRFVPVAVLSVLHWKEWREQGSGPVYLRKAKPLDRLLLDHPSQRKADAGLLHQKAHLRRRIQATGILLALIAAALGVMFFKWLVLSGIHPRRLLR
jgi:hypothetical protein